jgi:hypothetical protein
MLVLSGCDEAAMVRKLTPVEEESRAKNYIELLRQNKFEQIEAAMDESLKKPDLRDTLTQMAAMIPAGTPESAKVVGVQVFNGPDLSTTNLTFEYQFQDQWRLIVVALQKTRGASTIVGFRVTPIPDSLENLNRFTLVGRSILQYFVLLLAIAVPLLVLYTLVVCIRTKALKRKWLWVIFIVLALGKLTVNWTTGQCFVTPLAFQIPGGAAYHTFYSPWMISASFPLGAILFLYKRKNLGSAKVYPPLAPFEQPTSESTPAAQVGSNESRP